MQTKGGREGGGKGRGRTYQEFLAPIARGPSPTDTAMGSEHAPVHAGGVVVDGNRGGGRGEGEEGAAVGERGRSGGGGSNRAGGGEGGWEGGREREKACE